MICYPLKCTIIGDCAVGKSQLSLRFCRDICMESHTTTSSMQFMSYDIFLGSFMIRAQLWDLNGEVRVPELAKAYLGCSMGCAAVYDISSKKSFENLKNTWIPEARRHLGDSFPITLIGNKVDLSNDFREVPTKEVIEFAKSQNFDFIEVSALNNINVDIAFRRMIIKASFSIPDIDNKLTLTGLPAGWCKVTLNGNDDHSHYCNYWTNEIIYNTNFTPKYASYIPREFRHLGSLKPIQPIAYLEAESNYIEEFRDSPPSTLHDTTTSITIPSTTSKEKLNELTSTPQPPILKTLQTASTAESLVYQTSNSQYDDNSNSNCIPSCMIC